MNNKPPSSKRIAHQKKAQAGFSLAGGTLGLAALASRGKAARLASKARYSGVVDGARMTARAEKFKDRSTALTTAGAGIGGVGAYNFASYTNAEAKQKLKKNDPFEIHKLGSPKVRMQELTAYTQHGNSTTRHDADTIEAKYKGKSLILRRPKYQTTAYPSKLEGKLKPGDHVGVTPNHRMRGKYAQKVDEAYKGKKKSIDFGNGKKAKFQVAKSQAVSAFGVDHGY